MENEPTNLSVIPDIEKDRCVRIIKRLSRKRVDMRRVWCISRKVRGKITHSLVMPYSNVKHLTSAAQRLVVRYVGKLK